MKKAAKILLSYYILLGVCSLLFSYFEVKSAFLPLGDRQTELSPMLIPIIIGGIIALKLTLPSKPFNFFLVAYTILWVVFFILYFTAQRVSEISLFGRSYRFDLIIFNYYLSVSMLDTHLPFVLFWFIHYLYTKALKPADQNEETAAAGEQNTL